jgi:hypothetical protein
VRHSTPIIQAISRFFDYLRGAATALNFYPAPEVSIARGDLEALASDWMQVGSDLEEVLTQVQSLLRAQEKGADAHEQRGGGERVEGSRPDYAGEFRRIQSDDELRDFASSS